MSNRWKVWREYPGGWLACPVEGGTLGDLMEFHTHAGAMAYADHRARTTTVTLPRTPLLPGTTSSRNHLCGEWEDAEITHLPNSEQTLIRTGDGMGTCDVIAISDDLLEPVALTLLALARKGDSGGA